MLHSSSPLPVSALRQRHPQPVTIQVSIISTASAARWKSHPKSSVAAPPAGPIAECLACGSGSLGALALPGEHTKAGYARNRSVWVWESVSVDPDIRFHILTHSHSHMRPRSRKMRCLASHVSLGRASSPSEPLSQGRPQWIPPVAQCLGEDLGHPRSCPCHATLRRFLRPTLCHLRFVETAP